MTHLSITSESHTVPKGKSTKHGVSASLDRNYMDSSINDGLDVVFESVYQMTHAHDYQSTFEHADMDTCATYSNIDHNMFEFLHLDIYRWTQT